MEQLHLRLQETVALPALNQARILAVRALIPKFQVIVRISCRPDDKGLLLPQVLKVLLQLVKGARSPLQKLSGAGNGTAGNLGFQFLYHRKLPVYLLAPFLQLVVVLNLLSSIRPHDCVILGIA